MKPSNHPPRKIVLRRQTVRVLSPAQLADAAGGVDGSPAPDSFDGHCTLSNAINCAQRVGQR